MLLKDNIQRLMNLGLGGRTAFVLTKKVFYNSEKLAANKQLLTFLCKCSRHKIFPKTIENIKLPYSHGLKSIDQQAITKTKQFILEKSKKSLRRVIAIKQHEEQLFDENISSELPPAIAVNDT